MGHREGLPLHGGYSVVGHRDSPVPQPELQKLSQLQSQMSSQL